ncbi:hypothetical protein CMI37_17260 [Candidatus Pacearchaeota archaeon]|nr:hypothetical protein [Candidatus Pacearchaeota archaeon]
MADGITGFGTTLAGASTLSGDAAHVMNISISGPTVDDIDLTSSDSTSRYKAFAAGMIDAGEITFDVCYDGSSGGTCNEVMGNIGGSDEAWTVTFTDTSTWACNGYIKSATIGAPYDGKVTQSITLKLTAGPTYTDVA